MLKAILANLPALIVTLPMFAAPIAGVLRGRTESGRWWSWLITFFVTGVCFSASFMLFREISASGTQNYFMGAWPPPVGIEYQITKFNSLLILLVSGIGFLIMPYAQYSVASEIPKRKIPLFYSCYLLSLSGLLGMLSANDLFNIFVFLEISSLTAYAMIAIGRGNRPLTAAFNYLIVGTIGGSFYLVGVALLYSITGSLNFTDIAEILKQTPPNKATAAAFTFIVIGIAIKSAIFPLSSWLPRAYAYAPSVVSAFIAATSTKVSLYVFITILFLLFGKEFAFERMQLNYILYFFVITGVFYGSISAIMQNDVKRIFAFSSIANISYIVLGFMLLNVAGITAAIFHILAHAVSKGGAFLAIGAITRETESAELKSFKGIAKKMPLTTAMLLIFGISLIGLPLTAGFVTKWYFLNAAFEISGGLGLAVILTMTVSAVLTLVYIWRIVEVAYLEKSKVKASDPPYYMSFSMLSFAAATLYLGMFPSNVLEYIKPIAEELLI